MEFTKYAYSGKGAARARPQVWQSPGLAHWHELSNDTLSEVLRHLNDRQIARLARVDRRTRRVARASIQHCLGLGESQYEVFRAVLERRENVLIMGNPGSGKSFLLKILKERARSPLVTASTGAASDKIGASTLHSALGLGLGTASALKIAERVLRPKHGPALYSPCQRCSTLIVDEVSMLTAKILDLAGEVLVLLRGRLPQMVVSGDPMQLGAVCAATEGAFYEAGIIRRLKPYVLTESFRQAEDSQFLRILNRARLGRARESDVDWLRTNACAEKMLGGAPRLFCRLNQVHDYNTAAIDQLPAAVQAYAPVVTGQVPTVSGALGADTTRLKVGARVLLNRNLVEFPMLHNGSCGTVESLSAQSVLVRFDVGIVARIKPTTQEFEQDGKVVGTRTQLPLMLAFAVSVHRAQGATLDCMAVDLAKCFAPGQAYVALSRVRECAHMHLAGLHLWALNNVDKAALRYYNECETRAAARTERHRERERQAELLEFDLDDEALGAMMDAFEEGAVAVAVA